MKQEIVRPNESDVSEILRMCLAFKEASPFSKVETSEEHIKKQIQFFLSYPGAAFYIAKEGSKTVGMIAGIYSSLLISPELQATELVWWVDPEHRRTSLGQKLKEAFEEWAKEKGCAIVTMIALEDENIDKVDKIYRENGYAPTERTYMKVLKCL